MLTEPLHNGAISPTLREPSFLSEGELAVAEEAYYRPNSPSPIPFPGRNKLTNSPINPAPVGVRFVQRETGTDLIVAHSGDRYIYGQLTETGSEGDISFGIIAQAVTAGYAGLADTTRIVVHQAGKSLETAQLGDIFALVNGKTPILVKNPTVGAGTGSTKLGLLKPTAPTLAVSNTGATPDFAEGFWWVWVTEHNTDLDVESAASNRARIEIIAPNDTITVTLPTPVNDECDRFRVYIAGPTFGNLIAIDDPFPAGYFAATASFGGSGTVFLVDAVRDFTQPFPFLTVNLNGILVPFEINGDDIPNPTTIDVFENCFVCNDVDDPLAIRYTFPDQPGSWPNAFRITTETGVQDVPIKIRRVGRIIVVLERNQVIRINYLPRETDPEFSRGRVWDVLSSSQGCVGLNAADLVSFDGDNPLLVFFSPSYGLYATNGETVDAIEADIDWEHLIGDPASVVVRDFSRLQLIMVSYASPGSSENNQSIVLHYHSSHRKEGKLKFTGPISFGTVDAAYAQSRFFAEPTLITLDSEGQFYRENRALPPLPMKLRTRKIRGQLPTDRVHTTRLFVRHGNSDQASTVSFITERPGELPQTTPPISFPTNAHTLTQLDFDRELHIFQLEFISFAHIDFWIIDTVPSDG